MRNEIPADIASYKDLGYVNYWEVENDMPEELRQCKDVARHYQYEHSNARGTGGLFWCPVCRIKYKVGS